MEQKIRILDLSVTILYDREDDLKLRRAIQNCENVVKIGRTGARKPSEDEELDTVGSILRQYGYSIKNFRPKTNRR